MREAISKASRVPRSPVGRRSSPVITTTMRPVGRSSPGRHTSTGTGDDVTTWSMTVPNSPSRAFA